MRRNSCWRWMGLWSLIGFCCVREWIGGEKETFVMMEEFPLLLDKIVEEIFENREK